MYLYLKCMLQTIVHYNNWADRPGELRSNFIMAICIIYLATKQNVNDQNQEEMVIEQEIFPTKVKWSGHKEQKKF